MIQSSSMVPALAKLLRKSGDVRYDYAGGAEAVARVARLAARPVGRLITSASESDVGEENHLDPSPAVDGHVQRELHFVLRGELAVVLCGRRFHCTPGDLVYVDELEPHGVQPLSKAPSVLDAVFHFNATPWVCVNESPDTPRDAIVFDSHWLLANNLSDNFLRMAVSLAGTRAWDRDALILNAAIKIIDVYAKVLSNRADERMDGGRNPELLVSAHIRDTAGCGCTARKLAMLSGLSIQTLRRRFRERYGMTLHDAADAARYDFLRLARVNTHTQKDIGTILGFASTPSFNRWLRGKNLTGGTPARVEPPLMELVRRYIVSVRGENCSIARLAVKYNLSPSRLAHRYREEIGETIGQTARGSGAFSF